MKAFFSKLAALYNIPVSKFQLPGLEPTNLVIRYAIMFWLFAWMEYP